MSEIKACIIVPSHISSVERLTYLQQCLRSLTNQTVKIPVYLSTSFATDELKAAFDAIRDDDENVVVVNRNTQLSQFKHIKAIYDEYGSNYDYFMFCDDDDLYHRTRVKRFVAEISRLEQQVLKVGSKQRVLCVLSSYTIQPGSILSGEGEYWSYCLNTTILKCFFDFLSSNSYEEDILNHEFADTIFVDYIRKIDYRNYVHGYITEVLYNTQKVG